MPRPRKRLRPDDYNRIQRWSANGVADGVIAQELGMSPTTLREIRTRDPKAAEAFERGRAAEETKLANALFQTAMERKGAQSVTAAIFLLKCRHRYIDQPQQQMPENKVSITFQIPAALSPEQYREVVEVTPRKALTEAGVDAS